LRSHQNHSNQQYDFGAQDQAIKYIDKNAEYQHVIAIEAYYYIYVALRDEDDVAFETVKNLLPSLTHYFTEKELRDVYISSINYCIRQINKNKEEFNQQLFDLYKLGLDNKILLENGILTSFSYKNIIGIALKVEAYEWALEFLETYKYLLPSEHREDIYHFNLGRYYFSTKNYDAALQTFQEANFKETLYQLDVRQMMIRMYYERNEKRVLESYLKSSYQYLYRQENLGETSYKDLYGNLISFTTKLLQLTVKDKKLIQHLLDDVQKTELIAAKPWLVEQLEKLLARG
jgi:tetratricopeptide (TPR) repeat protein